MRVCVCIHMPDNSLSALVTLSLLVSEPLNITECAGVDTSLPVSVSAPCSVTDATGSSSAAMVELLPPGCLGGISFLGSRCDDVSDISFPGSGSDDDDDIFPGSGSDDDDDIFPGSGSDDVDVTVMSLSDGSVCLYSTITVLLPECPAELTACTAMLVYTLFLSSPVKL